MGHLLTTHLTEAHPIPSLPLETSLCHLRPQDKQQRPPANNKTCLSSSSRVWATQIMEVITTDLHSIHVNTDFPKKTMMLMMHNIEPD